MYRTYSARTFCESLLKSSRARDAKITSVTRYIDDNIKSHRFLICHVVRTSTDTKDFYLRLDRKRDRAIPLWAFAVRDRGRSNALDTAGYEM